MLKGRFPITPLALLPLTLIIILHIIRSIRLLPILFHRIFLYSLIVLHLILAVIPIHPTLIPNLSCQRRQIQPLGLLPLLLLLPHRQSRHVPLSLAQFFRNEDSPPLAAGALLPPQTMAQYGTGIDVGRGTESIAVAYHVRYLLRGADVEYRGLEAVVDFARFGNEVDCLCRAWFFLGGGLGRSVSIAGTWFFLYYLYFVLVIVSYYFETVGCRISIFQIVTLVFEQSSFPRGMEFQFGEETIVRASDVTGVDSGF
mmetsp:Transcript_37309/g.63501  ORF Transcript_37309/g.63501 Transcript_37309/m.63501 type:complete len:256 (+) Transcript_37309:1540-2307(+)